MRPTALAFAFALMLAAAPAFALQGWDRTPTGAPINASFGDQHRPVTMPDNAGGAFVAWVDLRNNSYDIYVNHVTSAGSVLWGEGGMPICVASGIQEMPKMCSDGENGFFIVWEDSRDGSFDLYAQHVKSNGQLLWPVNGLAICTVPGDQVDPSIAYDNNKGCIIAWTDYRTGATSDAYVQRLSVLGARLWGANGLGVCTVFNDQDAVTVMSDGGSGAIVTWEDLRNGLEYNLYAQHVTGAGAPTWAANGAPVCTAPGDQITPVACSDGAGGVIVAWGDRRFGNSDIYAQRLNASGAQLWGADGDSVCTARLDQQFPVIEPDGAGGAYIAWEDSRTGEDDIYAERVNAAGQILWFGDHGIPVCTAPGAQSEPRLSRDGFGYVICIWQDARSGSYDLYAQRLVGGGMSWWTNNGIPVCNASGQQVYPAVCSDYGGGALVFWEDNRNGANDIYGQRVLAFGSGVLGSPEPVIRSFADVPNDNGGFVNIRFDRTLFEDPLYNVPISFYRISRVNGTVDTPLLDVPASGLNSYEVAVPTVADSLAGVRATYTTYRVVAYDFVPQPRWGSVPDSAYSLDNIAPPPVENLTGRVVNNQVVLHWNRTTAPDLKQYRIYWGPSVSFAVDASTLRATTTDTTLVDAYFPGYWYKVTALDLHGNESDIQFVLPEETLDAPAGRVAAAFLAPPSPNPSSSRSALRFGLSRESDVLVQVFDAQGRPVRTLASGTFAAGEHALAWDGSDAAGHVAAPGLYFVRAKLEGREFGVRLVRVR